MPRYNPSHPTVILLPGGMGSQLDRTRRRYPASPNPVTNTVWIDLFAALKLEVVANNDDPEADLGSYVIGATGPVHFFTETP